MRGLGFIHTLESRSREPRKRNEVLTRVELMGEGVAVRLRLGDNDNDEELGSNWFDTLAEEHAEFIALPLWGEHTYIQHTTDETTRQRDKIHPPDACAYMRKCSAHATIGPKDVYERKATKKK